MSRSAPEGPIVVLDASALLALVFGEPGADLVADCIADGAVVSAVNLSEVAARLTRAGRDVEAILGSLLEQIEVEPFTTQDALEAEALFNATRARGLSLGDRSCLALAKRLDAEAVTAERIWSELDLGIAVRCVRAEG